MLKSYLLIGFIFLSILCYADGLRIVTSDGLQGVVNAQGEVLVPPIYEKLGWSNKETKIVGESIGYFENGKWGLINIKSGKLSNARYAMLEPFNESLFEAGISARFTNITFKGLIDSKSNIRLDFNYYTIDELADHLWLVSRYEARELKYGVFSDENKRVISPEFNSIESSGSLLLVENARKKFKIYDHNGEPLLDKWIDKITYHDNYYLLEHEGYQGRATSKGLTLPIKFKAVTKETADKFPEWEVKKIDDKDGIFVRGDSVVYHEDSDLFIAHVNNAEHILAISDQLFQDQQHTLKYIGKGFVITEHNIDGIWTIYKTDGRVVATGFDSVSVDETYFYGLTQKGWEVYNLFGRQINDRAFQKVDYSQDSRIPVAKNDYWGWVNFQGDLVINCRYDAIKKTENEDHFLVDNYGKWGLRTFADEWLIMPNYDSMFTYESFYIGKKGLAYHVFDQSGALVEQIPYSVAIENFLLIENQGFYGALTKSGKYIYPDYEAVNYVDGYYELLSGSRVKLISENMKVILTETDEVSNVLSLAEGYFHIIKDGQHGFTDLDGKLRIANRYDSALQYNEGLAPVKLRGKWGFIDKLEELVIQPYYTYSSTFSGGLAIIQIDGKYGIIDPQGEEIVTPRWKLIERLRTGNYRLTDVDDKVGLVNSAGKFLLRANFDSLQDTDKELVVVSRYGKKGVLNYSGLTQIPFEYTEVKIVGDYLILRKE